MATNKLKCYKWNAFMHIVENLVSDDYAMQI